MFKKTRRQLTLVYSGIIGIILLIMTVSFYVTLSAVIQQNEKVRIFDVAKESLQAWSRYSNTFMNGKLDANETKMNWDAIESNQFAIIIKNNGQIRQHSIKDINSILFQTVQLQITDWRGHLSLNLFTLDDGGKKQFVVFGFPIKDGSHDLLYIGDDISDDVKLLNQMKLLLGIFSLILLVIATGIGYILAGRAMIPITKAFMKQQEFTANASHELRTPLSVLQSATEILDEQRSQLPSIHQIVLNNMKEEIRRMIQMVEHLLILARNDSGQQAFKVESFDIKGVIYSEVDRMQIMAHEKEIALTVLDSGYENEMIFKGHVNQMQQLIYILLDNAIKYSPENSLVTIECHSLERGRLEIIVSDQGCGIPEKDIPFIFERFYRVDKARSRDSGGNGLGLAIAASITHAHGGEISVTSIVSQGSTFKVYLPSGSTSLELTAI